ncbi:MAG: exopolyphosphatase, partial [Spirochaetaceae bacterium]|nr:exopolyphosphatase [Spirochaetaceae bacterium]
NYQLMMDLIEYCREHPIEEILQVQDVRERTDLYVEHQELFRVQTRKCATVHKNVLVVDLRGEETIYAGNRFIKYALYPETNISIQVIWGFKKQNTVMSVGKSIFNRSSMTNVGELMLEYGGGGHDAAGTCQIENDRADTVIAELVDRLAEG